VLSWALLATLLARGLTADESTGSSAGDARNDQEALT
jgi:hypothetical protein